MHTSIAGLSVEVSQQVSGAPAAAVILCHGFGAPGDDLVPLAQELVARAPALSSTRFYFPEAPLDLGFNGARAWWEIDMAAVQRLGRDPEALRQFRKVEPPGMSAARLKLLALVREVLDGTKLPPSKLVLGGFSQGAMLATDVALRTEEPCAGLAILSGTLLLEDAWRAKAAARAGFHVFQAHGTADPVLPFSAAEGLRELLRAAGQQVEFFSFPGGHTISGEELELLAKFLAARVAA